MSYRSDARLLDGAKAREEEYQEYLEVWAARRQFNPEKQKISEYIAANRKADPDISAILLAENGLRHYGITFVPEIKQNLSQEACNILLAEAVNWAAKTLDPGFYALKPEVFVEAARLGVNNGVFVHNDPEEGTWSIGHPKVGVVSFHDPGKEITALMSRQAPQAICFSEPFAWSGVSRQDQAFELMSNINLVYEMAIATEPKFSDLVSKNENVIVDTLQLKENVARLEGLFHNEENFCLDKPSGGTENIDIVQLQATLNQHFRGTAAVSRKH